jgi:phage terminase small subunit
MANPKKNEKIKALAGTDRKDRAPKNNCVDFPLMRRVPKPPTWLPNPAAKTEWRRLAPILFNNKLLTESSVGPLAQLCALHGKIVQLYRAGQLPSVTMINAYRNFANDFGLTPVAQSKVTLGDGAGKGNKFASNKGKKK